MTTPPEPQTVIDAMRLAVEAAGSDDSQLRMLRALLDEAPVTNGRSTEGVALLVKKIREEEWSVYA